ncbi:hypothetical protein GC194_07555 [bacterium]|nr:hypothetical protein [bacterium]
MYVRLIFIALAAFFGVWIYRRFIASGGKKVCPRCHGQGYWEGTRERVTCDWCKGTGYLPKNKG